MIECRICGHKFDIKAKDHYISRDRGRISSAVNAVFNSDKEPATYDSFDCPKCGCQFVAQERKRIYIEELAGDETDDTEGDLNPLQKATNAMKNLSKAFGKTQKEETVNEEN